MPTNRAIEAHRHGIANETTMFKALTYHFLIDEFIGVARFFGPSYL